MQWIQIFNDISKPNADDVTKEQLINYFLHTGD